MKFINDSGQLFNMAMVGLLLTAHPEGSMHPRAVQGPSMWIVNMLSEPYQSLSRFDQYSFSSQARIFTLT